jgi:hypothetical protein
MTCGSKWTAEEDDRIRAFVAQGASANRASVSLKRKRHSVIQRARKLGCPFLRDTEQRKKWSATSDNYWPRNRVSNQGTPCGSREPLSTEGWDR